MFGVRFEQVHVVVYVTDKQAEAMTHSETEVKAQCRRDWSFL